MVRIAACDDNELLLAFLEELLADYAAASSNEISVTSFRSAEELLAEVKANGGYDIYILDIVMPGINGMEAAVSLRAALDEGIIIFLSASMEYAVKSYDVDAFYYLTKPVDPTKLSTVLDKACRTLAKESREGIYEVRTASGAQELSLPDIAYCDIDDRAVCYHLRNGSVVAGRKLRGSFSQEISRLLEDRRFFLCGSGLAVNLSLIDTVDDDSLLLHGGMMLYPSKSACSALKKQWSAYKRK